MDPANKITVQQFFLKKLESVIPKTSSLASELTDILEISSDSAYRRIRGETALTIDEVVTLCNHFKISFDSIQNLDNGIVSFRYTLMNEKEDSFISYLESLYRDLQIIKNSKQRQIIYACEDIPIFHNFNYPVVASFKMFYWMKSIMNIPELQGESFSVQKVPERITELGRKIYNLYASVPSTEIWTQTTILGTVKQIEFYWDAGIFATQEDALEVCEVLKTEMADIQKQAEAGHKFTSEGQTLSDDNVYQVYHSEIEITNNCVLVDMGEVQSVYLGHFSFNTMSTTNTTYCHETETWLNNIIKKSTLISGISEIHRYQYFKKAMTYLNKLIAKIEAE